MYIIILLSILFVISDFAFMECHADPAGGHLGRNKTIMKVKQRHYWPNQFVDMDRRVRCCYSPEKKQY